MVRVDQSTETIWGLAEQPTTISTSIYIGTYGNRVRFDVAGRLCGLRLARSRGSLGVEIGGVWPLTGAVGARFCVFKDFTPNPAIGTVSWQNAWLHPYIHVESGDVKLITVTTLGNARNYNDNALAADLTIGHFTYPANAASPAFNGAVNTTAVLKPSTADNARRFAVDVLFMPD